MTPASQSHSSETTYQEPSCAVSSAAPHVCPVRKRIGWGLRVLVVLGGLAALAGWQAYPVVAGKLSRRTFVDRTPEADERVVLTLTPELNARGVEAMHANDAMDVSAPAMMAEAAPAPSDPASSMVSPLDLTATMMDPTETAPTERMQPLAPTVETAEPRTHASTLPPRRVAAQRARKAIAPKSDRRAVASAAPAAPKTGQLALVTEPASRVFFEGRELGRTPIGDLKLPAGRQSLDLVCPNGFKFKLPVDVVAGKTVTLDVRLASLEPVK